MSTEVELGTTINLEKTAGKSELSREHACEVDDTFYFAGTPHGQAHKFSKPNLSRILSVLSRLLSSANFVELCLFPRV